MQKTNGAAFSQTYLNPVYPHSFPDPYVLKFRGEYFAYCTGIHSDGKVFGVLHSRDLVNWREIGGAMSRLESDAPFYWAPEVTYHNGKFYLYYSVGNETLMEIRVAVSDRPDGGFVDAGKRLTWEDFAIDAHVFGDENGERFLFYATDFLTHTHIGTGTVVDRLIDFFTLEGDPKPVTRAKYDWQVYDPQRKEKGGVRWHTVEGSFVLKRKGVYYQMFSGGNWQNVTYGVSFAVTRDLNRNEEWTQFSDGEKVFPILRTVPDLIVGPGHNSVVRGVNNRELFCVYHRWTEAGRTLSIDRMDFAGGARMFVKGATHTPQPAPFVPKIIDFFDEFSGENWKIGAGEWQAENNQIVSGSEKKNQIVCGARGESFLCEVWLRAFDDANGEFGVKLKNGDEEVFEFLFAPGEKQATAVWLENGAKQSESFPLFDDFDFHAFHLLRIETDNRWLKISLDENSLRFEKKMENTGSQIALSAKKMRAAFSGFALTCGFEDLFENDFFAEKGWEKISESGECRTKNGNLIIADRGGRETIATKASVSGDFEFAVNFRLAEIANENFRLGFYAAFNEMNPKPTLTLEKALHGFVLKSENESEIFNLPEGYSPEIFHQIRFRKNGFRIVVEFETKVLGEIGAPPGDAKIALSATNAVVEFDMARVSGW